MASLESRPASEIGRNSTLREAVRPYTEGTAKFLHEKFSWLSADMITAFGLACNVTGAVLAARRNNPKHTPESLLLEISPGLLLITGAISDAIDGPKARIEKDELREKDPGYEEDDKGQLKDAIADRLGTLAKGLSRAVSACQRGGLGEYAAYANVVTSSLSSITRAHAESKLMEVPENGTNPIEFIGNHVGRSILDTITTGNPIINIKKRLNIQSALDLASTVGTLMVADSRLRKAQPIDEKKFARKLADKLGREPTPEEVEVALNKFSTDAVKREKAMIIMAGVSILAVVFTHETLRGRSPLFGPRQEDPVTVFERSGSR